VPDEEEEVDVEDDDSEASEVSEDDNSEDELLAILDDRVADVELII
jgi:hypothetical protein